MKISLNDYHFKLIIVITLVLFIFKFFRTSNYTAIIYNSIFEFSVLFIFYIIFKLITRHKSGLINISFSGIYYILFVINFFIFLVTNYYFMDSILVKYSFFSINVHYFSFFINSIIQPSLIMYGLTLLIFIFLVSRVNILVFLKMIKEEIFKQKSKNNNNFSKFEFNPAILIYISGIILILFPLMLSSDMNNVYATTLIDISQLPLKDYTYVSDEVSNEDLKQFSNEINEFEKYSNYSIDKDRVLVFVMEQVSFDEFEQRMNSIPREDNFFNRVENDSNYFTNYYTQNQDSLGGLWSMLFSKFIAFESYIDNWNEEFGFILEGENLVDLFNYHNFQTTTAASQLESSLILGAFNWNKNIFLPQFPIEDVVCIKELEYQSGCEDIAIVDDVKEEIKTQEEIFLFQEFIFGHGKSYMTQSGMSSVEYYNMYLNLIYDFLEEENMVEDTTIVIVGDHGDKAFSSKEISNYKIPLMVVDSELNYREIDNLYSHVDFEDILMSYVDDNRDLPQQRDDIHIIGQTASSEFAYINSSGNYFTSDKFFKNIYTYNSYNMSGDEVKEEIRHILINQEFLRNVSSQKDFYCLYCEKNELDIISRRE